MKSWLGGSMIALAAAAAVISLSPLRIVAQQATRGTSAFPRTADGKPDLNGIWQVLSTASWDLEDHVAQKGVPGGQSVVEGGAIPYRPEMKTRKQSNYKDRLKLDPLNKCFLPGVPRITYLPFPFQISQTPTYVAFTYEYSHAYRIAYVNGSKHPPSLEFWMGDSRGRWEGDTLIVDVADFKDTTWFDAAGNFHSDALHVIERYTPVTRDQLSYEVTIEDPKVFTRPWKISMPLYRRAEKNLQLIDYECLEFQESFMPWDEVPQGLPKPPGK